MLLSTGIFAALFLGAIVLTGPPTQVVFVPSPDVPHDVTSQTTAYPTVSLTDLALFAWQEFAALNYPADPNHRGQPLAGASLGDPADAVVWETYWHRNEIFPYDQDPVRSGTSPVVTGAPTYKYDPTVFDFSTSYGGSGTAPAPTYWNNLDENNELNVDKMFAHVGMSNGQYTGFTNENRILYQAKMNEEGFAYILEEGLYMTATRDAYAAASSMPANLKSYGSMCGVTQASIVSLPCGQIGGAEGNIEIKAAWRKLTDTEMQSGKYYTNSVMHYESVGGSNQWFVDTYGLIGLHIIHKTVNFPSFVYATFEHVDNIASSIGYIDEITQTGRGTGDSAGVKVIIKDRDNPIPADVAKVNTAAQAAISGTVFANYQLVGVQAYPVDYSNIASTDASTYYLANIVIESNEELQNFRGIKAATGADEDNMYTQGKALNMGGCMGCHGVGQLKGADFNFLIANSPFTAPEVVGASGTISLRDINTYADVQSMFTDYVTLNGIGINGSPHGSFWNNLTYEQFTLGNVPNVSPATEIAECGDSESSAIVQILEGGYNVFPEMPAGGPYFPEEQVTAFAKWIDAGCPDTVNGTTVKTFGDLVWMTENLNEDVSGALCWGDDAANCTTYGRLYTAADAATACTQFGSGWRLPTDAEWTALLAPYGQAYGDGSSTGKAPYPPLIQGGSSGFDAMLAGKKYVFDNGSSSFYDLGTIGYYWTSDLIDNGSGNQLMYTFRSTDDMVLREGAPPYIYNSARCVHEE